MNKHCLISAITLLFALCVQAQDVFDHQHLSLDALLKKHVNAGQVNYKALKMEIDTLGSYLESTAKVTQASYDTWSREQQQAFMFNLYNAATLKLILDHYPVKSIKDIGGFFSGPWKQAVVPLWGNKVTLDHVEHEIIRPTFKEPSAHFALVCAAKGCPPLRAEAYVAERLNEQLEDQGRVFMASPSKNRVDVKEKVMFVSLIYDWFAEDFETASGSVEKFIEPYWPETVKAELAKGGFSIDYTEYDWTLNEAAP